MAIVSMKSLLEAGVHFGHQTRRWHPKMREYIYTKRGGIHIIDLQKTSRYLSVACDYVRSIGQSNGQVLFVGTKKQAKEAIKEEAIRAGLSYVNIRWLGGTLTNFGVIRKRILKLQQFINMREDGTFELLPKKEVIKINAQIDKLEKFLGGIKGMMELPDAIFIIDPKKDRIALQEAKKLKVPIVAVTDTNCDPTPIDYIIPANDDANRAVRLICSMMASSYIEGREGSIEDKEKEIGSGVEIIDSSESKVKAVETSGNNEEGLV